MTTMTVTIDRPTTTDPRTLITPELFDRLVQRIRVDHPTHAHQAERIMEQALAFLATCTAHPTARLAPSELIDIGWHTFILYTREYAAFCDRIAGRFIHHTPTDDPDGTGTESTATATVTAMRNLGLPVINDLWPAKADCDTGSGTGKCSQCHQGCTDS